MVVFSKNYCPYCRRALETLCTLTEPYVIDLTEIKDGAKVQATLGTLTSRRMVPNVFIGGKSIGGGDETMDLTVILLSDPWELRLKIYRTWYLAFT